MFFSYGNLEKEYLSNADKKMAAIINKYGHIYREVEKDVFKALIKNILSQQISSDAYKSILNRFIELTNNFDGEKMLNFSEDDFKEYGISKKKASYIKQIILSKYRYGYDFEGLKKLNDDEIVETLIKFKGVGKWTAQMTLIFSLERKDVFAVDDFGIRKGISLLYGENINDKRSIRKYYELFSPYSTIASFYIWEVAKDNNFSNTKLI
ncbi:MAG: DNA-3-methyladenine glycosylase 2 family protein [Tissierellales bacterium]|nr:DNA-3-methyladenine glycosylase 2 family protein [Tissierellales bacterium]